MSLYLSPLKTHQFLDIKALVICSNESDSDGYTQMSAFLHNFNSARCKFLFFHKCASRLLCRMDYCSMRLTPKYNSKNISSN